MANLYYCEDLDRRAFEVGSTIVITGDEARHAVRVARLRMGERTSVGNGDGVIGHGEVVAIERDRFSVCIDEVVSADPVTCEVVLVQALAKGGRDERAVEQATEFGVDEILPWQASRSVSRWDGDGASGKRAKGASKWARIAREASKQSLRPTIPVVGEPVTLEKLCEIASSEGAAVLVLHPRGEVRLSTWAATRLRGFSRILLVVGPEGGLTDREIDALESAGAHVLLLGETVLRTSSAGPAALAVLNPALGRW